MSDFKAKIHQIQFQLGLRPDPAGELTALPQNLSWILGGGAISKRGEGYG